MANDAETSIDRGISLAEGLDFLIPQPRYVCVTIVTEPKCVLTVQACMVQLLRSFWWCGAKAPGRVPPTLRRGLGYGSFYIGCVAEHRSLNSAPANLFWGL